MSDGDSKEDSNGDSKEDSLEQAMGQVMEQEIEQVMEQVILNETLKARNQTTPAIEIGVLSIPTFSFGSW